MKKPSTAPTWSLQDGYDPRSHLGMTARIAVRVKELGDASVPFIFDVHALYFAENSVRIEHEMHQRFANRRINRVNNRKEFFEVTPAEARDALTELSGELMTFVETPRHWSTTRGSKARPRSLGWHELALALGCVA